ncbi:MAG: selenocysteine-specific translation elongation factor [Bryobacterales bacterium]|nr:selenocysteine-specific translation elongation factor [Bryobacteraceae bacterium]MDW8354634.1 selenocysteine-specific translation elongation factor [Bryobacterales bacterium]
MKHVIAGTAGHIDHGKTALVKALTGIDTDRLAEEKRRGISIDLGFAHLDLGDVRIGFVDVPGHERFVKNMLAGAWGIDFVVLVIAADESVKPQTREHFDICRLLGLSSGLIALTKADLADPELLELVRLEVEEFVRGSFLEGAPIVPVSSVTGQGLEELRARLREVALGTPPKDPEGWFRLPVDRSFTLRGFGTVVTGTLISGTVAPEQEVEAHPGGRRFRVRGVHVHGRAVECAVAGQRTALNLPGAEPQDVPRGVVLAEPGRFRAVREIECRFHLLPSARPLKHRAPVHFHAATAEVPAEVRWLDGRNALEPGQSAWARILLRDPLLLLPGDRFIVRMFSPVVTIGGGVVLDLPAQPRRAQRDALARLAALEGASASQRVALLVTESPFGVSLSDMVARTGLLEAEIRRAASSGGSLVLLEGPEPWLIAAVRLEQAAARVRESLTKFHQDNPLLAGMPKSELRSRTLAGAPVFLLDFLPQRAPDIVLEGELVRLAHHRPALKQEEAQALAAIERAFEKAGLAVPSTSEVLAKTGLEPARARILLQMLLRDKRLVRVGEELVFHARALEALRQLLARHKGERFTVPVFKAWTGISRKYAIPLLEYLDRERLTRREGEERIVL